jgi:phosphoglycolate phosphatase-like HAD superfamily hydrolase
LPATDTQVALASSLVNSPRVYVGVLGAGASAAAGIPIASQVVVELVKDLAVAAGETPPADWDWDGAEAWYSNAYGQEPTYERILGDLGPGSGERSDLLARFFKGTASIASPIHDCLAELARRGLVTTFVTTNFDDLMEQALQRSGLDPYRIASEQDWRDGVPLHRHDAVVFHIHGHWQNPDTMKNTDQELASYPTWTQELARNLFHGHGKVIVGWSARYDPALRDLIREHSSDRFSTFWLDRSPLTDDGQELATAIGALPLIGDAVETLTNVNQAVQRLTARQNVTPASVDISAIEHDLAAGNTTPVLRQLSAAVSRVEATDAMRSRNYNADSALSAREFEIAAASVDPATITMFLALNGPAEAAPRWLQHASRLANTTWGASGSTNLIEQQRLPGLILMAAAAVGAAARNDPERLATVLTGVTGCDHAGDEVPLAAMSEIRDVIPHAWGFTALNEYLKTIAMNAGIIGPAEFDSAWERLEVAWSVLHVARNDRLPGWYPHGTVLGYFDNYTPSGRTWLARAYQIDVVGGSVLLPNGQREVAARYDRLFNELAHDVAYSHLMPMQGGMIPSTGWRIDEHGRGKAPDNVRASLARAVAGYS